MKGHLIHLFEYTRWGHTVIADAIMAAESRDARCQSIFAHILAAEEIWLTRMRGQTPDLPVWPDTPIDESKPKSESTVANWIAFLEECAEDDLKMPIDYTDSKGNPFRNSIKEVATHVTNHGAHHRAQIAARLRELGAEPPATDYIYYVREYPKTL